MRALSSFSSSSLRPSLLHSLAAAGPICALSRRRHSSLSAEASSARKKQAVALKSLAPKSTLRRLSSSPSPSLLSRRRRPSSSVRAFSDDEGDEDFDDVELDGEGFFGVRWKEREREREERSIRFFIFDVARACALARSPLLQPRPRDLLFKLTNQPNSPSPRPSPAPGRSSPACSTTPRTRSRTRPRPRSRARPSMPECGSRPCSSPSRSRGRCWGCCSLSGPWVWPCWWPRR